MFKKENIHTKEQMLRFYYKTLDTLNVNFEFKTVETSFGDTNVILLNNTNKPQLILVHGLASCAPFAIETLKGLDKYFKVYAIDILNEPNLSDNYKLNPLKNEHSKWFYEVLSCLQIYNAYFVGFSLGGYVGLQTLITDSTRFKKAFLINPLGIVKNKKELGTLQPYNFRVITKEEAQRIQSSMYIITAKTSMYYSTKALVKRVVEIFLSLKKVLILTDDEGISPKQNHRKIVDFILENTKNER